MKRTRPVEERFIGVLREHEPGAATPDVCRKRGISSTTFYEWKAKYGGLDVSDAKRLRSLGMRTVDGVSCWPRRCRTTPC